MAESLAGKSAVSRIHDRRMDDCIAQVFEQLRELEDKRVNRILDAHKVEVLKSVSVEYAPGDKQVLENALVEAKAAK